MVGAEMATALQQRLEPVRNALLDLHKTLVDAERVSYEQTVGAISSPQHFLQLLMGDPWFAWLQPLSQLIVVMDEALDEKEPLTTAGVDSLFQQTRLLLIVSEEGDGFSKHYFDALQRDPDVVLAHATAAKLVFLQQRAALHLSNHIFFYPYFQIGVQSQEDFCGSVHEHVLISWVRLSTYRRHNSATNGGSAPQ